MNLKEITRIHMEADLIYTAQEVEAAIEKMARDITLTLQDKNPVVVCLMIGGIITTGKLLPLLDFPLQLEYIHATRYRGTTRGGSLDWIRQPTIALQERHVLIVDDILDEGLTLAATIAECQKHRSKTIHTAVLVHKSNHHSTQADFVGLTVPNRYVFGYGMDYHGYLRNASGLYAVKE